MKKEPRESLAYSLRVGYDLWSDENRRRQLQKMMGASNSIFDEVALFTSVEHHPMPLETISERAVRAAEALEDFRSLGYRAGINHIATLGHRVDDPRSRLREPWARAVGADGSVSIDAYSPLDLNFQAYLREAFMELARARPDFLWIDDDFRLESVGGIAFSGFCQPMLDRLSDISGRPWTREALAERMETEDEGAFQLRRQILERNREVLKEIAALARSAIDEVDPNIAFGIMTADLPYSGWGIREWAEAAQGHCDKPRVKWRPGNGFYHDDSPRNLLVKAHSVGRMNALLPGCVTDSQYEHENFQYLPLQKSCRIFLAEVGAALAAGCNGVAFNMTPLSGRPPLDEFAPWMRALRDTRGFFKRQAAALAGRPARGIWTAFSKDQFAVKQDKGSGWLSGASSGAAKRIPQCVVQEIGLPPAFSLDHAEVTILTAAAARCLSDAEMERVFCKGVVIPAETLPWLASSKWRSMVGFDHRIVTDDETYRYPQEVFTDDPLNGDFAGWEHNQQMTFNREPMALLEPRNGGRVLSRAFTIDMEPQQAVSGAFENELGGRCLVLGYYPLRSILGYGVGTMLKGWIRWLARDRIPIVVTSYHRVAVWARGDSIDDCSFVLMNASLDPAERVRIDVRCSAQTLQMLCSDGRQELLRPSAGSSGMATLELPTLQPWETVLISEAR